MAADVFAVRSLTGWRDEHHNPVVRIRPEKVLLILTGQKQERKIVIVARTLKVLLGEL